ncbi:hypothetical protein FNF29_07948 [Cafeteria roenbergensis]|uniref:ATPase F1/V1/A1 complex alpha/beta subunit nucleotide-binding domain-containing protein n=1 Tax=Cafeteria roenbergensis TaxID=33653 RepID=A0A5A8C1J8_CAFRO|nr:hypothetical protein FNF29_07948 [Cafeteria roenbergensis]|eukprot:KAA0146615.1 hypothetical protein FNF29_07948 [Cafeteria roenbergensis]
MQRRALARFGRSATGAQACRHAARAVATARPSRVASRALSSAAAAEASAAPAPSGRRFRGYVESVEPGGKIFVRGAWDARLHHLLEFDNGARALVTELLADGTVVAAPLSGDAVGAQARARCAESPLTFPVGAGLTGRVFSPLGVPLDGGPAPTGPRVHHRPIMPPSMAVPRVLHRARVPSACLPTGFRGIDALHPLQLGGAVAIAGPASAEPGALAADVLAFTAASARAARSESGGSAEQALQVTSVVCLVGRSRRATRTLIDQLTASGAMADCVVIAAPVDVHPAEQFVAPFAALSLAAELRDSGRAVVLVVDDLLRHASAATACAPSGSSVEAAALHGQLVDAAAQLSAERGAGSLTLLAAAAEQSTSDVLEAKRVSDAAESLLCHFPQVWTVGAELQATGARPPVEAVASGRFGGSASQGSAMQYLGSAAARLLADAGESAKAAARAAAVGLEAEARDDALRGLYARLRLVLAPVPSEWEAAAAAPRWGDGGSATRLAASVASRAALEEAGSRLARDAERQSLARGGARAPGSARPSTAARAGAPLAAGGSRLSAAQQAALDSVRAARLARRGADGAAAAAAAAAAASSSSAGARGKSSDAVSAPGSAGSSIAPRWAGAADPEDASSSPEDPPRPSRVHRRTGASLSWAWGRATPAQTLVSLFASVHGYTLAVPLCRQRHFELRLWRAAQNLPAPEGSDSGQQADVDEAAARAVSQTWGGALALPLSGFAAFPFKSSRGVAVEDKQSLLDAALTARMPRGLPSERRSAAELAAFALQAQRAGSPGKRTVPVAVSEAELQALPAVWQSLHRLAAAVAQAELNEE